METRKRPLQTKAAPDYIRSAITTNAFRLAHRGFGEIEIEPNAGEVRLNDF